jgi:hypothetical protein
MRNKYIFIFVLGLVILIMLYFSGLFSLYEENDDAVELANQRKPVTPITPQSNLL